MSFTGRRGIAVVSTLIACLVGFFASVGTVKSRALSDEQLAHVRGSSGTNKTDESTMNCDDASVGAGQVASRSCVGNVGKTCIICDGFGGANTYFAIKPEGTKTLSNTLPTYPCANATRSSGICKNFGNGVIRCELQDGGLHPNCAASTVDPNALQSTQGGGGGTG